MKKLLTILLVLAAAGAAVWYFVRRKSGGILTDHLNEQQTLQNVARVASKASLLARPPAATYSSRGPLDGAVASLIPMGTGLLKQGLSMVFRPTASGDPAYVPPEDRSWDYSQPDIDSYVN